MDYKITTLPNALRLLVVEMPNLESAALTVWVGVGSRFESEEKAGISHFLEHMVFKGTPTRPTAQDVSLAIDSIGAVSNAGTSQEWTNFYLKSRADLLANSFDILSDIVLYPLLKDEDIERERGVIIEEIAMKEDVPMEKVGDNFISLMFKGNPLARDIAGTAETVKKIEKNDFVKYRDAHYSAKNIILTVAGGVKEEKVRELAENYFGSLNGSQIDTAEPFAVMQKKAKLHVEKKKSEQAHFYLGFPAYSRTHPDRYAEGLLATILGRGMSSRLFTEIREKRGLAYSVGTSVTRYVDTGVFATYAGVDVKKAHEAIKVILDQTYGIISGEFPISQAELTKAKDYQKGKTALALEDTLNVNDFFGEMVLFREEILRPEEVFREIDKVTLEDVNRAAKEIFVSNKLNLAVIGPFKDEESFEKILL